MAPTLTAEGVSLVFLTGFIPPLLWLWFWLKEDPHPEPKNALFKSFILGVAAVPFVILVQSLWKYLAMSLGLVDLQNEYSWWLLIPWAFAEEIAKFGAAWWADLRRSVYDEPVDAIIYLITVALGFAAMENFLFLLKIMGQNGKLFDILATADYRFMGATLLHTVTAGIVGVSIAFTFFHPEHHRRNIIGGIILATVLHTAFNIFIINAESSASIFRTMFAVWTLALVLIFFFERVKRLNP
ncbi:PrsW family intramembrane metalloprotease [Candidatus Giovannonibacteria bacterium]|nr:PrsW family intramembrane metalloprotease [Candidatus Giovannonibacteria bacterium]